MPNVQNSRAPRIASVEPCNVEWHAARRDAMTWNVSAAGVYLVIEPVPDVGERIRLSFRLPNDPAPVRADGRIAWQNPPSHLKGAGSKAAHLPPGCGVEFVAIEATDRARIEAHVAETTRVMH